MYKSVLIINADDFGHSTEVNHAILASLSQGLCSSTTLMANMPGFEEACRLCYENDLADRVGLHLVLSEGFALTDAMKRCPRFCNADGRFVSDRRPMFRLNNFEKGALAEEISAQIDRCRKFDIPLTHVDSHHHVHVEWAIAGILLGIAKEKGLRYVRLARHLDPDSTWAKNLYRRFFNYRLMSTGVAATKYFGTIEDFVGLREKFGSNAHTQSFEIMVHPAFDGDQNLVDSVSNQLLARYLSRVDGHEMAVSFGELARSQLADSRVVRSQCTDRRK
jgi:predicted glycoside hydrolase/deacetylase ChbG (UPF0249 family)